MKFVDDDDDDLGGDTLMRV